MIVYWLGTTFSLVTIMTEYFLAKNQIIIERKELNLCLV